ncbi:Eco57I restriction-modification methylase domain-containing protein [Maledivibacter halophilus]|uniref:site-specific DNA-methyltransferase (adenine-specific) n=1 Tax=Maledivibacter halophilus TaxID=36842 RepID=A0A1T5LUV7_9FIRM|nr:TaqI-like C-terminal specificity domain-containing protein [Maledivibacter halophilus]SKC79770.1 adenine-specific DNA-methyltransferase [Maledivibacter halophilus]
MENNLIKVLDDILLDFDAENMSKEEVFINLIRKAVFKKTKISYDSYIKFLNESIGNIEISMEDITDSKELSSGFTQNLDLLHLCSIFEEYLNDKVRELTGSYYTPNFIIEFMVSNSLKVYFEENAKINNRNLAKLIDDEIINDIDPSQLLDILDILSNLRIIDISCGSGLFLHHVLKKIFMIRKRIYKELSYEFDEYAELKSILEKNIYGVDIQQMPLEMAILKYIDILNDHRCVNLEKLNINMYKRNSVLGNEIFNVSKINDVINEGGFDIVIGNPPYIGEKGNKSVFEEIKKYEFGKKYYEGKMDYFYYFIYRGIDILKDNGVLSYITTNYFITADGAKKLRKHLRSTVSFKNIINFNEYEIFKSARGQHNMIFTITKGAHEEKTSNIKYIKNYKLETNEVLKFINNKKVNNENITSYIVNKQSDLYGDNGNILVFPDCRFWNILKKIRAFSSLNLGDICNINQGIVSGADKVTQRMLQGKFKKDSIAKNKIEVNEGIFILDKEEIKNKNMESCKLLKPFYKNSNIKKYFTNHSTDKYILYFTDKNICNEYYCFIIQEHLKKYKDVLELRRETQRGIRSWFALQWYRDQRIFEGPKIVVPHRALQNNFGYNEDMWYASADVYFITGKVQNINLKVLLGLLNSRIMYFWLYNMGKRKGNYLELYSSPLSQIPINISFDTKTKEYVETIVNEILSCCRDNYDFKLIEKYQYDIDRKLYKVFGFNMEEIELINKLYMERCFKK